MEKFLVLYSATLGRDYGFIAFPNPDCVSSEVAVIFRQRINFLMADNNWTSDSRRWLFDREVVDGNSYLLWGVACLNSVLSADYSEDEYMRRLRCFVGFIAVGDGLYDGLPYNVKLFTSSFKDIMALCWDSHHPTPIVRKFVADGSEIGCHIIGMKSADSLNYSDSQYRVYPSGTDGQQLFGEALMSGRPVSVVSDVPFRRQDVKFRYEPFLNVVPESGQLVKEDVQFERTCVIPMQEDIHKGSDGVDKEGDGNAYDVCEECGCMSTTVADGLCEEWRKPRCCRCGRKVGYVHKDDNCKKCHSTSVNLILLLTVLVSLVLVALGSV